MGGGVGEVGGMSALVQIHCQSYEKNLGFCLLLGRNRLSYPFLVRMIKQ